MVGEYGFAEEAAGRFWSWVGFFSLFSAVVFGALSDRFGRKVGLAAVFSFQTVAYLLAGSQLGKGAVFGSVTLYGIAAFAIPAIMAAAVGDYLGRARAAAGMVAESSGTFTGTFLAAAALTAAGALLSSFLPRPPEGSV